MRRGRARRVEGIARLTAIGLGAGRTAIGASVWIAPTRALAAGGFAELDPKGLTLARMAGARDLVIGIWQLAALDDRGELRRASLAAAAADAADALAFALLLPAGSPASRASTRGLPAAAAAAGLGLWVAWESR